MLTRYDLDLSNIVVGEDIYDIMVEPIVDSGAIDFSEGGAGSPQGTTPSGLTQFPQGFWSK
jgi:hypothetical protein